MAKHRAESPHLLTARAAIGGAVVSGALLVGAPAGMAMADSQHLTNRDVVSVRPSPEKKVGAVINKVISNLPASKQAQLVKTIRSLPPEAQAEIGKIAKKLGVNLGGATKAE
jgi:hypothetical protein